MATLIIAALAAIVAAAATHAAHTAKARKAAAARAERAAQRRLTTADERARALHSAYEAGWRDATDRAAAKAAADVRKALRK
jgi:hypothetical protein